MTLILTAAMCYRDALAVARLRQWVHERRKAATIHTPAYVNRGWAERRATQFDAALVRCIDMERVLDKLPDLYKTILILHYRDGQSHAEIAIATGTCERTIFTKLPEARHALAILLDKLDLL
jgi:DNA-directed RNA polymerase specialized sigma24 family protein